ncbi:MAG: glycosyltransferase [Lachnospiraceae bacterium]|nr:glycosyltransferase [Lachnospiraceae bacterium]
MTILFYRYNSICEEDLITAFQSMGLSVVEIREEITNKEILSSERVGLVDKEINTYHPLFVFSINFFPEIAELCSIHGVFYLCLTVDSPVNQLFSESIKRPMNRIFLFDRAQYDRFSKYNPECIFHLPLASAVSRYNKVLENRSFLEESKMKQFRNDISFVGSLYNEKNPLNDAEKRISDYTRGFVDGLVNIQKQIYGTNLLEQSLNDRCVKELKELLSEYFAFDKPVEDPNRYIAAHSILGMELAEKERIETLNALAENYHVTLYTRSDTSRLKKVDVRGGIRTHTEMPLVFRYSKINLNMTVRPIETGLPLRIFDIMGCGGFVMTNYQEELADLFTIGEELEVYASLEELIEKCGYYLSHEEEREKIARNGYEAVKKAHTWELRVRQMISKVIG